jgi:hypothetical protein
MFSVAIVTLPSVVTEDCDVLSTDDFVNFQTVEYKSLFHSVQSDCSSMSPILLRCYRDGIVYYSKQPAAFLFLMQRSCDQLNDISHFVLATNQTETEYYCLLRYGVRPFCPYTVPLGSMLAVPYLRLLVACFLSPRPGFEPRSGGVRFLVGKVAGFLRAFRFHLQTLIPPTAAPHSSSSFLLLRSIAKDSYPGLPLCSSTTFFKSWLTRPPWGWVKRLAEIRYTFTRLHSITS